MNFKDVLTLLLVLSIIVIGVFAAAYFGKKSRKNFCNSSSSESYLMKKVEIDHMRFSGSKGIYYFVHYKGEKLSGNIHLKYKDRLNVGDSIYAFFRKDLSPSYTYWVKDHPCDTIYWDSVRLIN